MVDNILKQPRIHPRVEEMTEGPEMRYALLKRFPYKIVYELGEDEVVVYAVAHVRRRANYWKNRLG